MSLTSGPVLGLAAVVTSPALWHGLVTRELPIDLALTRYLVAVLVVWMALSAIALLVGQPEGPAVEKAPAGQDDQDRSIGSPDAGQDAPAT